MGREYHAGDELVPGFRLAQFLGRGGFGQVWKCTAPGGAEVALKIIDLDQHEGARELRALRLVKKIRHANLVPITACWVRDDQGIVLDDPAGSLPADPRGTMCAHLRPSELIIAMGLGEMNLLDRLRECQQAGEEGIPIAELLEYLEDAARGLDYLHAPRHDLGSGPVSIQHCDVKPQNIVIVGAAAQVCDFGMARVLSDARQTRTSLSVAYAAPESIEGCNPSPSTDQYSLAISYVELRTGNLPFEDQSSAGRVLRAHLAGKLDLSHLSAGERAVIRKATALAPSDRYPNCVKMIRDLRKACGVYPGGTQILEPRKPSSSTTARPSGRSVGRGLLLACTTCVTLAGLVVGLGLMHRFADGRVREKQVVERHPRREDRMASPRPAQSKRLDTPPVRDEVARSHSSQHARSEDSDLSAPAAVDAVAQETQRSSEPAEAVSAVNDVAATAAAQERARELTAYFQLAGDGLASWQQDFVGRWQDVLTAAVADVVRRVPAAPNDVATSVADSEPSQDEAADSDSLTQIEPPIQEPDAGPQGPMATDDFASLDSADVSRIEDQAEENIEPASEASLLLASAEAHAQAGDYQQSLDEYSLARERAGQDELDAKFACLRVSVLSKNASLLIPGQSIVRLRRGTVLRVESADGEWLWVVVDQRDRLPKDRKVQAGWMAVSDVQALISE